MCVAGSPYVPGPGSPISLLVVGHNNLYGVIIKFPITRRHVKHYESALTLFAIGAYWWGGRRTLPIGRFCHR